MNKFNTGDKVKFNYCFKSHISVINNGKEKVILDFDIPKGTQATITNINLYRSHYWYHIKFLTPLHGIFKPMDPFLEETFELVQRTKLFDDIEYRLTLLEE